MGSGQCLFFGTKESSNAPAPTLLGLHPSPGLTAEPALLRSCSKELGRGFRHPCFIQRRKLNCRVYAKAAAMPMVISRTPSCPCLPGLAQKEGLESLSPGHSICWLPLLASYKS